MELGRYNAVMTNYDIFAPHYDNAMGDRNDVIDLLKAAISRHRHGDANLLELGCGTGSILAAFQDSYILTGIDLSDNMLKIAQQKLPRARLIRNTIAGFDAPGSFDVILCVFDTINHLTDFSDWKKLFTSAKKHLRTNGLFIFDMDTIDRLNALAAIPGYVQKLKSATITMKVQSVAANEVEWHLAIEFPETNGAIQVREEHVREAAFTIDVVRNELENHFTILEMFDSNGRAPSPLSDRVYFACR